MEFLYLVGLATPAAVIAIIVLACYMTSYKNSAEMWENKYHKEIRSLKQDLDKKKEELRIASSEFEKYKKMCREEKEKYEKLVDEKDGQILKLKNDIQNRYSYKNVQEETKEFKARIKSLQEDILRLQSENSSLKNPINHQKKLNDLSSRENDLKAKEKEYSEKKRRLDDREKKVEKAEQSIQKENRLIAIECENIENEREVLRIEKERMADVKADIDNSVRQLEIVETQISSSLIPLFGQKVVSSFIDSTSTPSFLRGLEGDFSLDSPITLNKVRVISGKETYEVSLTECSCPSRHRPCKHMVWLALNLGVLHLNSSEQKKIIERISESTSIYQDKINDLKEKETSLKKDKLKIKDEKKIIESKKIEHPELAKLLAEYEYRIDENRERKIPSNALKSADIVKLLKTEKKQLMEERTLYFNKVTVYESLFPWLLEFKDMSIDDVRRLGAETSKHEDYVTFLRFWLTPEEYTFLSPSEKLQQALERCKKQCTVK